MATDDERIGETLRILRGGMSQAELAENMAQRGFPKWSQSTVWTIEKGTRPLRLTEAKALADIFSCGLYALLDPPEVQKVEKALRDLHDAAWKLITAAVDYDRVRDAALPLVNEGVDPELAKSGLAPGHLRVWLASRPSEVVADLEKGGDGQMGIIPEGDGGFRFITHKTMGWPDGEHPEA